MNIGVEYIKRGIRLMVDECKDAGLEAPVFMSSEYQVTAIFQRNDYSEDKSKLSNNLSVKDTAKDTANYGTTEDDKMNDKLHDKLHDKILELMQENERVTIPELSNMLGVSVRTINSYLKKMQEMNLIIRVGARKNGYWKVNI